MISSQQEGSNLRDKTIRGISWSVISRIGHQAISFVSIAILARLLSPREFGILAMITVITSFASLFSEMGFSAALVQKQDIRQEHLSSVFWLNLAVGLLLTVLFMAGAPLVAQFYGEPILVPLTQFVAINFVIGSLSIVQRTMLTKAIDFRRLSIVDIVAVAVSAMVAIILAYMGAGVWSLAVQVVLFSATSTVILWAIGKWRPSLLFDWAAIQEMLGFSLNHFGNRLLNYWVRNIDYLLIGRLIGTQPLGVYKNAYTVMLLPLTNVSAVISRVMFPSLSLIQQDKARVRQIYLRMTRTVALITFPVMTGLFVVVEPFVFTFFGSQWSEMIPILRIFCLTGMMQSIGGLNGNLYLSQGRSDLQLRVGLWTRLNAILWIVLGLRWGILGVAVGYTTASLINSYPSMTFASRLVNLTYWQVWRNLLPILGCALFMVTAVWGLGLLLPALWPHWLRLAMQVPFGALVYGAAVHLCGLQGYLEVRELLQGQLRLRRNKSAATMIPLVPDTTVDSR